jgi:integrase
MSLGQEWQAFVRLAKLVGTQGVTPRFHDLRHTFAMLACLWQSKDYGSGRAKISGLTTTC